MWPHMYMYPPVNHLNIYVYSYSTWIMNDLHVLKSKM